MTEAMNRQGEESKPCVVFFDDYDSEPAVLIRSEMKKWANACKVTLFIEIRDFKEAKDARTQLMNVQSGVIFLASKLARGVSLKMDRDAIVFTVFLSPSLPGLNLVRQMVGRGSRSFGRCIGYVYAIAPITVSTNASLSAQLELRDKVEYSMQAVEILKLAMKAWRLYGDEKH